MIDAGLKNLFSWFSEEYPDYILTVSPLFTGNCRVKVTQETERGQFGASKVFIFGEDYFESEQMPDVIRAWIPALIAAIHNEKRGANYG